jgi:hypothetical protein
MTLQEFVEQARVVTRRCIAQLPLADQSEVAARLERDPLPGTVPPRLVLHVEMTPVSWSLQVSAGGAVPLKVCEANGTLQSERQAA